MVEELLDSSNIPTHPLNPPPQAGDFFLREHDGRYVEGNPREVWQVGLAVEAARQLLVGRIKIGVGVQLGLSTRSVFGGGEEDSWNKNL